MDISHNLKRLRKSKGFSQAEVSAMMGFKSHNAYSHWECGKTSPSLRDLDRLAELFGVSVQKMLFSNDSMSKHDNSQEIEFLKRENSILRALVESKGVILGNL